MSFQGIKFISGRRFPDVEPSVSTSGGENDAIRAVGCGQEPVRVFLDAVELLASNRVPELDVSLGASENGVLEIRGDIGSENNVVLFANFEDSLARLDVPGDDVPGFTGSPASAGKIGTVRAEGECLGESLGVGQDSEEIEVAGVVEKHLLLTGDCENGGPGTVSHRGNGVGTLGNDFRLEEQMLGHGRGTFGLPGGSNGVEVDLWLVGFASFAVCGLEKSACDPVREDFQFFFIRFGSLWRHERLFGVG